MASTIGIKIANGEFYPIMEENSSVQKRLILTTVHDRQDSVQIDLFSSAGKMMLDAQYIGSLVIENIKPKPKGEPSIEMVMSSNASGEITADAIDLDTGAGGEHHVLSVSLKSLDETVHEMDLPDFELENNEEPPTGLYNKAMKIKEKQKPFPWTVVIIIIAVLLIGLLGVWLFLYGGKETVASWISRKPEPVTEQPVYLQPPPVTQPAPVQSDPLAQLPPPPVIAAPVSPPARTEPAPRDRPPAPVMSYNVPATIPREGAPYTIRWGDTLWDISEAFYRNPWLYPRIAQFNNIRNPDLIISGSTIRVPPRN
jgi:hypothetical protein